MAKPPLCVAFLWHMHQPDYSDAQSGEIHLPWTRFHAAKDYYDMAALAAEQERMHLTINIVPILMDQLDAYSRRTMNETYAMLTQRDAASLEAREKSFLLRGFFQLPWNRMVYPSPRYTELLEYRGAADEHGNYPQGIRRYTEKDYRDLQVWFNLSWCGETLRRNPEICALFDKAKGFSEEEKRRLLDLQFDFAGQILPFYGRLLREQRIELSVSPYYHAILPLLCDHRCAREALPEIALPSTPFSFQVDAREQIERALERFAREFGSRPAGMWPSEGSISETTADLARDSGLRWLCSDDGVLHQSLRKENRAGEVLEARQKFCAYEWSGGGPCFFFRDHGLSDLIGFTYARWNAEEAAADFIRRLHEIRNQLPEDGRHYVVPIILDGENAWEHYAENGTPFLRALYRRLAEDPALLPLTFSEYLELEPHREPLRSIVAGSWIYNSLSTWIGHSEKNRAWEFLGAARRFLASRSDAGEQSPEWIQAYREILVAEGSDWFWWYGDDHHSENAAEFDELFRRHVKNVYRLLRHPYPPELDTPIKTIQSQITSRQPSHTISPCIDGKVTDFFEWMTAGSVAAASGGGSMHRSETCVETIYFGFDTKNFYLRLDLEMGFRDSFPEDAAVQIHFTDPAQCILALNKGVDQEWRCTWLHPPADASAPLFAGDKVLELAIPLNTLGINAPETVRFSVMVLDREREIERVPRYDFLTVRVDPMGLDHQEWIV